MTAIVVEIAIAVVVTLVLTWLAFVVALALFRPRGIDLHEAKRLVPDVVRLVRDLARDADASRGVRWRLSALLVYLALPFDLVPDFLPVLGYADDVVVVALVLRAVVRRAGPDAIERHWRGSAAGLSLVRSLAGVSRVR